MARWRIPATTSAGRAFADTGELSDTQTSVSASPVSKLYASGVGQLLDQSLPSGMQVTACSPNDPRGIDRS